MSKTVKRFLRRIATAALWTATLILFLLAIGIGLLAFPQVLLSRTATSGTVVIHSDAGSDADLLKLAANVEHRLRGSRFYDSLRTDEVFYIQNPDLYSIFTTLALMPEEPQGFAISFVGNSFVSRTRVAALGERTGRLPKYSIWAGDPAHTIAHEIGHLYVTDRIGRTRWLRLPRWKQEGFPEYIANIGLACEDSSATLPLRIDVLHDQSNWTSGALHGQPGWDRIHYEAGLLVEFLLDIRGLSMDEILADSVTRDGALADMMAWARHRDSLPSL